MALNPMVPVVTAHRDILLYGRAPNWSQLAGWGLAGILLVLFSIAVFRALEDSFVEET
jgi:ABC-type polysaccharide/polyol phosphate export permease